jgi:hypothetical protein
VNTRLRFATLLLAACLVVVGRPAAAQGVQTGSIEGTARDAAGLVLPDVTVHITSPALQGPRRTTSDANGVYVLRGLPPGTYLATFERAGFGPATHEAVAVDLGRITVLDVTLQVAGVAQGIVVTVETPPALATAAGGINLERRETDLLAGVRALPQFTDLAPGATGERTTPDAGQAHIAGGFAYDNLFLVDGVDVNDNLFGTPNPLVIEDMLAVVQVLTSGITAEYGRFSGGVVNAVTRSGGNVFSGSLRLQLTNDGWTARTPFEIAEGRTRPSNVNTVYEATAGGPIVEDRLWFLLAGRMAEVTSSEPLPQTGLPFSRITTNRRGEIKLTGTVAAGHTLQGSVLTNPTSQQAPAFPFSIDPATAVDRRLPNTRAVVTWRGLLGTRTFGTAQFSEKRFGFRDSGGISQAIVDSPFLTLTQDMAHYNAPFFDATDPEDRDNRQFTGSLAYFLTTARGGSHDLKGGAERYRSRLRGGNSQSSTGFVFVTDYVEDADGRPAFDAEGRLVPRFVPEETELEQWIATRGAGIDLRTTSLFVQDRWAAHARWTVDAGLRYERVRSEATGALTTIDTDTWMPRLGASYDATGDGRVIVQATYGLYAGRSNEAQFGRNTPVGNPTLLLGIYTGPEGQGRDFAPGFSPAHYEIVFGDFPTANVFVDEGLASPTTREWTAATGWQHAQGHTKVTYVRRRTSRFIEDFITRETGTTTVTEGGITRQFQNLALRNSDEPERRYQGLIVQSRHRLSPIVTLQAHWTLQLRNHGNFEGETTNQPAISSVIGDYPDIRSAERHYPVGPLSAFQRHKVRAWTIVTPDLGARGQAAVSLLYRYDAPTTYSLAASGVPLTAQQESLLAGYASRPLSQTIFFEGRGTGRFSGSHLVDTAVSYQLPVWRTLGPWMRFEVINLFNSQPLIRHNITVRPDPSSPPDALGLATRYVPDARFGQGESNAHYPLPRTIRLGVGFRF